jgi:hypothetical protein
MKEGHRYARQYPLAYLWSEVRIVRQRLARQRALEAVLMQMVIGSMFNKDAGAELKKTLERMDESE